MTITTATSAACVAENAARFWAEDLAQIEGRYLHGKDICSLPADAGDERVPTQGTVLLRSTIDIGAILGKPTLKERFGAAWMRFSRLRAK